MFAAQLPILLVSLLACLVIGVRRNELSTASSWALMGFGLSVLSLHPDSCSADVCPELGHGERSQHGSTRIGLYSAGCRLVAAARGHLWVVVNGGVRSPAGERSADGELKIEDRYSTDAHMADSTQSSIIYLLSSPMNALLALRSRLFLILLPG